MNSLQGIEYNIINPVTNTFLLTLTAEYLKLKHGITIKYNNITINNKDDFQIIGKIYI